MKKTCSNSGRFLVNVSNWILLLCINFCLESPVVAGVSGNDTDRLALLDFKNQIKDPLQALSSWNDSIHFCNWNGVSCSPSNGRVVTLNLNSRRLVGSIPPSVGNLTFLTGLNLENNSFHGVLPQELGFLRGMQHLNLSSNAFGGKIPSNLTYCTELRVLDLADNNLIGEIPDQLSSLSQLAALELGDNNLTGMIPSWIGNFSSLSVLSLTRNNFRGSIPSELGQLSGLGFFQLTDNDLSGTIPSSIYNLSSIYYFFVTQNRLHGQLPPDVGLTLPSLVEFGGGENNFTGTIPVSLTNASGLQLLDFGSNGLTGSVPRNLGSLQNLYWLNFEHNNLGFGGRGELDFLSSLANCSALEVLKFNHNYLGGELPNSMANLSTQLRLFLVGRNLIYGRIPIGIENLVNLTFLALAANFLNGSVPDAIGKLQKLEGLALSENRFTGSIPSSFGNLTRLSRLSLEENRFEGSIPSSLGNCQNLELLNLSSNQLSGTIPEEIMGLSSLSLGLDLSNNSLTGSLPLEVGSLHNLAALDVSGNKLSGEIPATLGSCTSLQQLYLQGNEFEGTIPESLKSLGGIDEIDLSRNNLSGRIPEFLGKLVFLKYLNLSYNNFEGEVPSEDVFAIAAAVSMTGNDKLCGGILELQLPTCTGKTNGGSISHRLLVIVATTAVVLVTVLSSAVAVFYMVRKRRKNSTTGPPFEELQLGVSYMEIKESTNDFSAENLIGSGSFGCVYKGLFASDGRVVAIKVFNLQLQGASESFIDECNALRSIRHRNLLKIITACSSIDHQGNDFKALVFEFMSHGSLDQWLHPGDGVPYRAKRLTLIQRLNISIDVASALDYLHHHCETPIVHCDLKPSNVLIDEDMTAHVADFGLARFLFEASNDLTITKAISVGLKGSIGYIAPEYGLDGQVSTLGDAYSFGILLLEMFTGKRPTDEIFQDDLTIQNFVSMALPEHVMDIIDHSMLVEENGDRENDEERAIVRDIDPQFSTNVEEEFLVSIMRIGLSCSSGSPGNRMSMSLAVKELQGTKESFLKSMNRNRKRMQ